MIMQSPSRSIAIYRSYAILIVYLSSSMLICSGQQRDELAEESVNRTFELNRTLADATTSSTTDYMSSLTAIRPEEDIAKQQPADPENVRSNSHFRDALSTLNRQQQVNAVRSDIVTSLLARSVPVLRPSIEEKASELSKKYLNLEHDNWRLSTNRQQPLHSAPVAEVGSTLPGKVEAPATEQQQTNTRVASEEKRFEESAPGDKKQVTDAVPLVNLTTAADYPVSIQQEPHNANDKNTNGNHDERISPGQLHYDDEENHYHHYEASMMGDAATLAEAVTTTTAASTTTSATTGNRSPKARSGKRQMKGRLKAFHDELHQCQRYLQQHSTTYSRSQQQQQSQQSTTQHATAADVRNGVKSFDATVFSISSGELMSTGEQQQHLPCSCELRQSRQMDSFRVIGSESSSTSGDHPVVWLNCDNVQLYANHQLYASSTTTESTALKQNRSQLDDTGSSPTTSLPLTLVQVQRFSQRDSALQTIQAQKFYNLQLVQLKTIDLSMNRIRQIQMDAFHGLELTLERLDLSNNLLGDSRAIIESFTSAADRVAKSDSKLIFSTEELSKLKKLQWLSLRNNFIRQLSTNVFAKSTGNNQTQMNNADKASTELSYIDLSNNLLQAVPSEAIMYLHNLKRLDLSNNRLMQLDRQSKFPVALNYIDLSSNIISEIDHCDLIDLPELTELDLSDNQLSQLDLNAFISSMPSPPRAEIETSSDPAIFSSLVDADLRESNRLLLRGEQVSEPNKHSRKKRDGTSAEVLAAESTSIDAKDEDDDELLTSESKDELKSKRNWWLYQQQQQKQLSQSRGLSLKLNLSLNYFETFPGDSLLKFVNLQQLDLSNNRIRTLDANYLCSIFNMVDNLRLLDLSGNLLTMAEDLTTGSPSDPTSSADKLADVVDRRSLNRLFGCLQKLETLRLSKNRLSIVLPTVSPTEATRASNDGLTETLDPIAALGAPVYDQMHDDDELDGDHMASESNLQRSIVDSERLVLKFNENSGGKSLKSLDLSDNHLKLMPIIKQIGQPPSLMVAAGSNNSDTSNYKSTKMLDANHHQQQAQLNQWISSRVFLERLDLSYNYLERLEEHDFEDLLNLRELHLSYNKLSHLPVKIMQRFTSLDKLSLDGNQLSSIDPLNDLIERSTKTLRDLNLAQNRLMEWPQLSCVEGAVQSYQLDSVESSIRSSSLHYNYKSDGIIDVHLRQQQRQPAVAIKKPEGNRQTNNKIMPNFALEKLNLEGNLLTSQNVTALFDQLIYMKSLRVLNLSFNLLNRIKSEWFKYANKNLQKLSLTGNKINSIELGAFASNQVSELIQLDLNHNLLKELKRKTFDVMPKIKILDLSHNMIHTINSETFNQISSLQVLKLNHNKLTSWKCEYFTQLCNLITGNINLDLNTLVSPISSQLPVDLDNIESSMINYQYIFGDRYSQADDPHDDRSLASSLVELDLSHNSISQLRANSISVHTKLIRLNLEHNKLSYLPHDLFKATTSAITSAGEAKQVSLIASLKYINLAHNRIQTIDNINFRPLRNLVSLDLSNNEMQTIGIDVVGNGQENSNNHRNIFIHNNNHDANNNLTELLSGEEDLLVSTSKSSANKTTLPRKISKLLPASSNWPALSRLRRLNLANNLLTNVNQSILADLSPFVALNLNLSSNNLDTDSLPNEFCTKISTPATQSHNKQRNQPSKSSSITSTAGSGEQVATGGGDDPVKISYDLIFTLKIESIDLSHNRLNEFPTKLLDNHYTSLESCNFSHNRIQSLLPNSNSIIQIKSLDLQFNPLDYESNQLLLFEKKSVRYLNLAATRLFTIQQSMDIARAFKSAVPDVADTDYGQPQQKHPNDKHRFINSTTNHLDLIRSISRPIDAPYLRYLNLSSNQLVWLSANAFEKLHSLRVLDLSHNQLTRLHLLNNQLRPIASNLDYLNLASNLFTEIDGNDLTHLVALRQLDLSNLLSLQKMDCRFLAKMTTLKSIKMLNYPQMRQNMQSLISALYAIGSNPRISNRIKHKIRNELMFSTIGKHCFRVHRIFDKQQDDNIGVRLEDARNNIHAKSRYGPTELKWFNLEEIDLELFNNFDTNSLDNIQDIQHDSKRQMLRGGSFRVNDELKQLLGPKTRRLTLIGLNLTHLGEESLLGITGNEVDIKISYTSINQLPLSSILNSVAKTTRLHLDLRNNNLQTIDVGNLIWLDELQQSRRVISSASTVMDAASTYSQPVIKLGANPFRCDCQTRPLWLWLNQRWANSVNIDQSAFSDDLPSLTDGISFQNDLWNRFSNQMGRTSDIKCYYPLKLRGKLVHHVNYNDLICSRSNPSMLLPNANLSSKRAKVNETRSSDSYYLTSINADSIDLYDDLTGNEQAGGIAADGESSGDFAVVGFNETPVRVTRFNRYPATSFNMSVLYSMYDFAERLGNQQTKTSRNDTSLGSEKMEEDWIVNELELLASEKIGRPNQGTSLSNDDPVSNTNYSKHRPNTRQRHLQYASSFESHLPVGKSIRSLPRSVPIANRHLSSSHPMLSSTQQTFLTDSDVIILTAISVSMLIMFFVIMTICLFKYKLDCSDKDHMVADPLTHGNPYFVDVGTHGLFPIGIKSRQAGRASAFAMTKRDWVKQTNKKTYAANKASSRRDHSKVKTKQRFTGFSSGTSLQSTSSNSSQGSDPSCPSSSSKHSASDKSSKKSGYRSDIKDKTDLLIKKTGYKIGKSSSSRSARKMGSRKQIRLYASQPALMQTIAAQSVPVRAGVHMAKAHTRNSNFLMRSPTIRRMHGLATNASDWFKYTMRAHPSSSQGNDRRRLFLRNNIITQNSSQLTTSELANQFNLVTKTQLPAAIAQGCPLHEFRCLSGPIPDSKSATRNSDGLDDAQAGAEIAQCLYCNRLLEVIRQTQIRHAAATVSKRAPAQSEQTVVIPFPLPQDIHPQAQHEAHAKVTCKVQKSNYDLNDKYPKDVATGVNLMRTAIENISTNISSTSDNYMTPKLIRALAEQLDQQHLKQEQQRKQRNLQNDLADGEASTKTYTDKQDNALRDFSDNHARQQIYQTRSRTMRTFGSTNLRPASSGTLAESIVSGFSMQRHSNQTSGSGHYQSANDGSQLPNAGVSGRFAYQLDSQSESGRPNPDPMSPSTSQCDQDVITISSTTMFDKTNDMLVLVRDTPSRDTNRTSTGDQISIAHNHQAKSDTAGHNSNSNIVVNDSTSSFIHADECSRTSSPVAYGFMRSSPSITTNMSTSTTPVTFPSQAFLSPNSPIQASTKNPPASRPPGESESKVVQLKTAFENRIVNIDRRGPNNNSFHTSNSSFKGAGRRSNNDAKQQESRRQRASDSDGGGGCTSDSSGGRVIVSRL